MAYNRRRSGPHSRSNNRSNNYRNSSSDSADGEERRFSYGSREYNQAVQNRTKAMRQAQEAGIRGDRVEAERFLQAAEYFHKLLMPSSSRNQRDGNNHQRQHNSTPYQSQTHGALLDQEGRSPSTYGSYGGSYEDESVFSGEANPVDVSPMRVNSHPVSGYSQE